MKMIFKNKNKKFSKIKKLNVWNGTSMRISYTGFPVPSCLIFLTKWG